MSEAIRKLTQLDNVVIEARQVLLETDVPGTGTPESEERIAVKIREAQDALADATTEILDQLKEARKS